MQQTSVYKSLLAQMVYVIVAGLALLLIPNVLLKTLGFPEAQDNWISVFGMLVLVLSFYYYNLAYFGSKQAVFGTVIGRFLFCIGLISMAFMHLMPMPIIGFSMAELIIVVWTVFELKSIN